MKVLAVLNLVLTLLLLVGVVALAVTIWHLDGKYDARYDWTKAQAVLTNQTLDHMLMPDRYALPPAVAEAKRRIEAQAEAPSVPSAP